MKMNFKYLAVLFCALVTSYASGNSLTMGYSIVQAQQEPQQPSTITYDFPWSNNLSTADPGNSRNQNAAISSSQTISNSKNINLNHSFVSNKVVGPDRFRFVTSYWTLPDTSLGIDVGTSANKTFLAASPLPPKPDTILGNGQQVEVDTNEGPSTLAVVLQYQGVVSIAGLTAALKLPTGFKAQFPLTDDKNNYDIALSDYRGHIYPGQGIVLYFPVNVLPTAKIVRIPQLVKTSNATGLPELAPLALHFLRSDERSTLDLLDGLQQNMFAKALSVSNTRFPNSTNFDNFDLKRHYFNQFGRFIPYDFVNQVIPVILAVTGKEILDVVTLPSTGKPCGTNCKVLPINATTQLSKQIVEIPSGVTTKLRLALVNTGDVPFWYADVNIDSNATNLQSILGINGLNPSAITSPNIPQTLFSTINPLGIVGPQDSLLTAYYLPPNSYEEFDVTVFPSHYAAGTLQVLNIQITGDNVLGNSLITENRHVFVALAPP
jgi:hypothetical protein